MYPNIRLVGVRRLKGAGETINAIIMFRPVKVKVSLNSSMEEKHN